MAADLRPDILRLLTEDLVGPIDEHEVLAFRPSDRYLTGLLYPQRSGTPEEEQEQLSASADAEEDSVEEAVPLDRTLRHASAGISFSVQATGDAHDPHIDIRISAARYQAFWLKADGTRTREEGLPREPRWERTPCAATVGAVAINASTPNVIPLEDLGIPNVELRMNVAPVAGDPCQFAVTVVVLNCHDEAAVRSRREREEQVFFQAALAVRPGRGAALVARPSRRSGEDEDLRLIYRHAREYAVGHVCAATWSESDGAITEVASTWLPKTTVPSISPEGDPCLNVLRTDQELRPLSAVWLADAPPEALQRGLELLPRAYEAWLDARENDIPGLAADLHVQARRHIQDGRRASQRMRATIALFREDAQVREAFQLANRAMALQRQWTRGEADLAWRPFQLGFQLLTLESIARRGSADRGVMDLLWFPTGGGKTEAYLGLIAFTLFYRRLAAPKSGTGVGVIMRYTLRLLTIQQFQRAASLICACEYLRRVHLPQPDLPQRLGPAPFSLGLWVGGAATPNTVEEAARRLMNDEDPTPRQLTECPACQRRDTLVWRTETRVSRKGRTVPERIVVRCDGDSCPLRGDLPVWTVDEDLYREAPSLLIGTVDKFAQIVRKPEPTSRFFGAQSDPPDLIIQDELHLISGPLGTLTGLYEVAIDELCTRSAPGPDGAERIRPKIIGSTATIRRATEQGRQLFDRSVAQFPPPILDADNSCFAVRDENRPGRLYVGVTSAGRSPKFTLQAVCGSLLQSVASLAPGSSPADWDPWWTLVAYFNSLRELGGALVMMYDDVPASINLYAGLRGAPPRDVRNVDELTSRKKQSELRDTLANLSLKAGGVAAFDAILATNMISVGVDVPRLGLMVVNGQPKQIAEYIQATSRVGRSHPGLIVSVYNNGKVRDRSHYETFATWHGALYRDVEPTSVTPFASRAQDRALHAVLAALVRHTIDSLRGSPALTAARREQIERTVTPIIESRAESLDPEELAGVRRKLAELLDHWEERSRSWEAEDINPSWRRDDRPEESLLISAEAHAARQAAGMPNSQAWPTPNSMREVEPGAPFKLVERLRVEE